MTVYVMRKGVAPNTTPVTTMGSSTNNINFDCPTNPIIHDTSGSNRIFAYISTDDTHTQNFVQQLQGSDSAGTEYSNLHATEGYRIKCWNEATQTGIQFKSSGSGSFVTIDSTYDYFVLISSDSTLEHHFAKITEFTQDDVEGDSFEFEPRLGTQVAKDTKFIVFRGPLKTETTIVAVAGGIQSGFVANSSYNILKGFNVAKPSFYFYNDRLDKKNELDHDTKYYLSYDTDALSSATVSLSQNTTFITVQDFNLRIKDYSKYTIKADLVDKLRDLDDPRNALSSNEGFTVGATPDFTDYDDCFYNARSHDNGTNDNVPSATLTNNFVSLGHKRYVHYELSPVKNNFVPLIADIKVFESSGQRGAYCESKIIDVSRIMSAKVKEFDFLRARHIVYRGNFNEFLPLKAVVDSNVSGNQYTFDTDYDLTNLIAQYDEVMVGDRILIVSAIGSFSSNQQTVTFESENRLENESVFNTSSYTLSADQRLKRRAWSPSKNTLLTAFPLLENRYFNMKVVLIGNPFVELEADITSVSETQKTLTLSFNNDIYDSTLSNLDYYVGDYYIEIERFEGEIEQIDIVREFGQSFLRVFGRSSVAKLISPIVNEDTLFSKDIIYSSDSPFNELVSAGTISSALTHSSVGFTFNTVSSAPAVGDKLYVRHQSSGDNFSLIGTVRTYDSGLKAVTLEEKYPLSISSGLNIYKDPLSSSRNYIFNKALSSNNKLDVFPTSLTASTEKGVFFEGGVKVSDGTSLVGTSDNADFRALGYHIYKPLKVGKGEGFQAQLGESNRQNFETANTLMDFTVLNVSKTDGQTTIELAPYVPLTLGRLDYNDVDTYDVANFDTIGTTTNAPANLVANRRYIEISTSLSAKPSEGDAIYVDEIFVGYCTQVVKPSTSLNWRVYVDRAIVYANTKTASFLAPDTVDASYYSQYSPKKTSHLYFVNGEHLHGGKMVTLLNSLFYLQDAYESTPTDYRPTFYTAPSFQNYNSSVEKFGNPIYKLEHIEKGNFNISTPMVTDFASKYGVNYYNKETNKIKYYSSGYKIGGNIGTNSGIIHDRYEETSHLHLPIEARGRVSPLGSLYFDYFLYENGHTKDTIFIGSDPTDSGESTKSRYLAKDMMEQYDPKAERLFLFVTCDRMPYSSNRSDSLMSLVSSTDDLKNYQLLLLNEASLDDYSDGQSQHEGTGKAKKFLDSDYESAPITSADRNISSLVRTGIMRLTEVTFDGFMNQINAEKPPSKKETLQKFNYHYHNITSLTDSGGSLVTISSYGSSQITLSGNVTLADGDLLVDSGGNLIGVVSGVHTTVSTISLTANPVPTNNGAAYTGTLYKADKKIVQVQGHGETESFVIFNENIHPLKSGFFDNGFSSTEWNNVHTDDLADPNGIGSGYFESNLFLPFALKPSGSGTYNAIFGANSTLTSLTAHPSLWFKELDKQRDYNGTPLENFQHKMQFVSLDNYSIEGTRSEISKGTSTTPLEDLTIKRYSGSNIVTFALQTVTGFSQFKNPETADTFTNDVSEGTIYANKIRIKIDVGEAGSLVTSTTVKTVNDATLYKYSITDSYLDFFTDLTGTYLVSESGREFETATQIDNTGSATSTYSLATGINNMVPDIISYVVSHEIETDNSTRTHIIVTDTQLTNQFYRVMQPNETAFYDFTPKDIKLNALSSEYTKVAYANETYDTVIDYHHKGSGTRDGASTTRSPTTYNSGHGHNEAVLSMYVLVDLDEQSAGLGRTQVVPRTHTYASYVLRNQTDSEWENPLLVCMSDGNNFFKTSMQLTFIGNNSFNSKEGSVLTFEEMKELHGVVSLSEIFTVTTTKNLNGNPKRALIGSTVSVSNEAEDLVNNLLEKNDIEFTRDAEQYPMFLAPNYRSVDLFSAINYLLERKEKRLIYEDSKFKILDKTVDRLNPKVLITDMTDRFQIRDFNKSDVLFDFFNEIIVYGRFHSSKKQNISSIKTRGRKTLEVEDYDILTQVEADRKATELLRLHSSLNQKVELEIGHRGLSQLQSGDVIELELKQENIQLNRYLILQIEHTLDGFMKMQLGRFSKGLEDRLAEILIDNKKTKANIRSKQIEAVEDNTFLSKTNLRERKLLIKSRTTTGGGSFTIGFGTAMGFISTMGFGSGGTTTETIQVEKEL